MIKAKKLKHNKLKNTGLIFELLVRQVTTDILNKKKDLKAKEIIQKFFTPKSELVKENAIYNTIISSKNKPIVYIRSIISEALKYAKDIDVKKIKKEKYELVKTIKENYGDDFWSTSLSDYKIFASIYKLLVLKEENDIIPSIGEITNTKEFLVEALKQVNSEKPFVPKIPDVDTKLTNQLTFRVMVDSFNKKYSDLSDKQKDILKYYIENINSSPNLRKKFLTEIISIKNNLKSNLSKIEDDVTQIKLKYVLKNLDKLKNTINKGMIKENTITSLLLYAELEKEMEKI